MDANADYHERRQLGIVELPNGETEGRDPREISKSTLEDIGHERRPLLSAIRSKCLDCSHTGAEVRRCTSVDCALWPYRMGTNPLRAEPSEARKAANRAAGERLSALRNAKREATEEDD